MPLSIATWNINSVRLRAPLIERFLQEHAPDILCLQEIKCMNDQFPGKIFHKLGYEHQAVHGQKGYHGVATISKKPLSNIQSIDYVSMGDTRHIATDFEAAGKQITLHNFYVPAGGDVADREKNPKFDHKLKFVDEMKALRAWDGKNNAILVGDLNIAPYENDVWSHKQLLKVVSHTPIETKSLLEVLDQGDWRDLIRAKIPMDEKVYTWWSYRARDWAASNRGRRLDHIWSADNLAARLNSIEIIQEARGWEKASDHVPVIARFDID